MNKVYRSCPLWKVPAKNLTENQPYLCECNNKFEIFRVLLTFSRVYNEVPMNTTLMGKRENMMPLWMLATILNILSGKKKKFIYIDFIISKRRFLTHKSGCALQLQVEVCPLLCAPFSIFSENFDLVHRQNGAMP